MKIRNILLVSLLTFNLAQAKDLGVYGATFPISEESMTDLIQKILKRKEENGELEQMKKEFQENVKNSVLTPTPVDGLVTTNDPKLLKYVPTFVLPQDVRDANGVLLYPKGITFNPLDTNTYPSNIRMFAKQVNYDTTLIFLDARDNRQLNFALDMIKQYEEKDKKIKIILTGGNIKTTSEYLDYRVYFDQNAKLSDRMGLQHVPTIVYQDGDHFNLQEYSVEHYPIKLKRAEHV